MPDTDRRPITASEALERLRRTPEGALDAVLADADLDALVRAIAGGWLTLPLRTRSRRELLDLLTRRRIDELSAETVARLLHAMRRLPPTPSSSSAIRDALRSRTGEAFRDLKYLLNASGDHHDLEHIVFEHLLPPDREAVLAHIREQAEQAEHLELRILCDIDDTVRSLLHDPRWPRGTVYPGVVALLHALDRGRSGDPWRPGDLTFVTARPGGPRGIIEQYTRGGLADLGMPPHTVLGGSLLNLFTKSRIAARKLQNFERERLLFPECRKVFIGDSGQADPQVGAAMRERDPEFVVRVLIHDVVGLAEPERAALAAQGVETFGTYAGAARMLADDGLIERDAAEAIDAEVRRAVAALEPGPGRDRLEAALAAEAA
ncbi:hypothetical protein [Agrococcus terreus]|uniref:Phosphatidate phosphatase APP1 n=1 Tax=Agrococcus terreus TaxID=574649 RepID=A0ABQ2KKR3_9MICO|nr:hypothetical protein [Agrococcus terreus]GGN84282.1 hypothetical protein GCM10010968_15850 [Agrococcus terreus]